MYNTSTHRARFPSVITRLHPSSISVRADTRVVNRLHPSSISVRAGTRVVNRLHPSSISVRADTRVVNRLHPSSISVRALCVFIRARSDAVPRRNHFHPSLPDETRMSSSELDLMHFQVYDTDNTCPVNNPVNNTHPSSI